MTLLRRASGLAAAFAVFFAIPAPAADSFYEDLERQGIRAAARGDHEQAVKLLRLASFGMLEEPPRLAACLAHLMTAQAEIGDEEGFNRSFRRLLEAEQRFRAYSQAELSERVRARLEDHLERLVPHEVLLASSTFRAVARRQMTAQTSQETPAAAAEDGPAAAAAAEGEPELGAEEARLVEEAREVMRDGSLDELIAAFSRIRQVAEEHPEHAVVQHLAGELAYRVKLWPESRGYFERGGVIEAERPDLHFYYAVVLFETGDVAQAAAVLEECLPRLRVNDFIREYAERIRRAAAGG